MKDRERHDENEIRKVLQKTNVSYNSSFQLVRIGKPRPDKPRLLKVIFPDVSTKMTILRNKKALRSSNCNKNVFINDDQTPLQQQQSKLLRAELKRRRDAGEEDAVVYRNKVVLRKKIKNFHKEF